MALDVPDNNPQYDSDEVLRQIMGQGMFPKAPPDGTNVPMRPGTSAPGQPTVPMASADGVTPQQYPTIPKPAPAPVASAVQPPSIANITPGPVQPRLDNPPQMPPAPPAMDPNAVGANGKSKYRMSLGERIAGTAANFLNGFARNGQAAVYVGRGARNQQWNQDQELSEQNRKLYETATQGALRQGQIEKFEAQGQAATDRANTAEQALKDKTAEFGKTIEEKQREFDKKQSDLANKPSKVADDVGDRTKIADQMGLKGMERRDYILTGHLPKEFAPKDDKTKRGTPAQFSGVESKKKAALDAAEKEYTAATKGTQSFMPGAKETAQRNLEASKQRAQEAYESEIQALGGGINPQGATPAASAPGAKLSTDEAKSYLTKAGWDGKTAPTPDQKAKARSLAQKDKRSF